MIQREKVSQTIKVDRNGYFYLRRIERKERGCKPLTEEAEERIWQMITKHGELQEVELDNDSMGGGDGTYWGQWWPWSVQTLKEMLDAAGIRYTDGKEKRTISIIL